MPTGSHEAGFVHNETDQGPNSKFIVPINVVGQERTFSGYRETGAEICITQKYCFDDSRLINALPWKDLGGNNVRLQRANVEITAPVG